MTLMIVHTGESRFRRDISAYIRKHEIYRKNLPFGRFFLYTDCISSKSRVKYIVMRILKQFFYAIMFISIVSAIGFVVYEKYTYEAPTCFDNIKNQDEKEADCGGPCVDCAIKGAYLSAPNVRFIDSGGDQVTIISEVINPIIRGAFFVYKIDVIGKFGGILTSIEGASFVRRMNSRYIVLPGVNIHPNDVREGVIEISEILWEPETKADTPVIETTGIQTVFFDGGLKVTGNLRNLTDGIITRIRITALLVDRSGEIISASVVSRNSLKVTETAPFTIFFPEIDEELIEEIEVKVFPEVIPQF